MESRALFFTPAVCRTIKATCVPFARNGLVQSGFASEDQFLDKLGSQGVPLGNSMFLCTANGKVLDGFKEQHNLWKWLASWPRLPASERRPGAVQVAERGPYKPNSRNPKPPADGLIVRTYLRALDRDAKGRLFAPKKLSLGVSKTVIPAEPNRDFLWLTRQEWQSLVPAEPKAGDRFQVAAPIRDRIFRFHLVDGACCLPGFWEPKQLLGGDLSMTLADVSPRTIHLVLTGVARLGAKDKPLEFQVDGLLRYDRRGKCFTRFDIVAVSKGPYHKDTASGKLLPLGIAFELSRPDHSADHRPPYRIWYDSYGLKDYFGGM